MAAFGLLSGLAAEAANIKITSLPLAITAPGTYVLTGNLTSPSAGTAITIAASVTGSVVVDLKGFTLTGTGEFSTAVFIGDFSGTAAVSNEHPITVRNGTIPNFGFGVWGENVGQGVIAYLSDIDVDHIVFHTAQNSAQDSTGVLFDFVNSSTISNCSFNVGDYGIEDIESQGGNTYSNDTFFGMGEALRVIPANATVLGINHCNFAAPHPNKGSAPPALGYGRPRVEARRRLKPFFHSWLNDRPIRQKHDKEHLVHRPLTVSEKQTSQKVAGVVRNS
jgi:hypothetical protein